MMKLKLNWIDHRLAKYAVENWHYSHVMPAGKLVKIGIWENDKYVGCIIFGRGANNNLAKSFQLRQIDCVELTRIAMREHQVPVSKCISIALKMLKKLSPGIKLVVSYADFKNQGHLGKVYQASNWIYLGARKYKAGYIKVKGIVMHTRSAHSKYGSLKNIPEGYEYAGLQIKHLYIYPFDAIVRNKYEAIKQKYPAV